MELIGKWKIKKILCMTDNGIELIAAEDIPNTEDYDESRLMCQSIFDFRPDGMAYMLLTPEQFAQRDTDEEMALLDGMAIVEKHPWKEENGEFYYHTGAEGDIGGEEIDPYEKLELDDDGYLPMIGGMALLEKIL